MMNKGDKIYLAGHRGMVGSAIHRKLLKEGFHNIITATSEELDLRDQSLVRQFFSEHQPDYVILAAAKVGGINANNIYRAEFLHDNLAIQNNVIHSAHQYGIKKLLFLGSSCIYPRMAPQPLNEDSLLSGKLEQTNEPYAIAKIAGIKMCEAYYDQYGCKFISVMPTNMYGPNDNYDLENSHVLPALIRKFHEAKINNSKTVELWGTGSPKREFLHVDDLAEACYFLLEKYEERQFLNVGVGEDISIKNLGLLIKKIVGFDGELVFDESKPDGTPRKLMNVDKINALGWKAKTPLKEGITAVYQEYVKNNTK